MASTMRAQMRCKRGDRGWKNAKVRKTRPTPLVTTNSAVFEPGRHELKAASG